MKHTLITLLLLPLLIGCGTKGLTKSETAMPEKLKSNMVSAEGSLLIGGKTYDLNIYSVIHQLYSNGTCEYTITAIEGDFTFQITADNDYTLTCPTIHIPDYNGRWSDLLDSPKEGYHTKEALQIKKADNKKLPLEQWITFNKDYDEYGTVALSMHTVIELVD